jgi:ketosteroid isomerase-like protein
MSQENVEAVRRMTEALDRANWDGVFAEISPDFEWETDPRHPKAGIYRGREEFRRFMEDLEDPFEQTVTELEKVFATADQVIAFVKIRRRLRGSSSEVEIRIGELYTLREGKLVRGQAFAEREKALEAAGLSEQDARADS